MSMDRSEVDALMVECRTWSADHRDSMEELRVLLAIQKASNEEFGEYVKDRQCDMYLRYLRAGGDHHLARQ